MPRKTKIITEKHIALLNPRYFVTWLHGSVLHLPLPERINFVITFKNFINSRDCAIPARYQSKKYLWGEVTYTYATPEFKNLNQWLNNLTQEYKKDLKLFQDQKTKRERFSITRLLGWAATKLVKTVTRALKNPLRPSVQVLALLSHAFTMVRADSCALPTDSNFMVMNISDIYNPRINFLSAISPDNYFFAGRGEVNSSNPSIFKYFWGNYQLSSGSVSNLRSLTNYGDKFHSASLTQIMQANGVWVGLGTSQVEGTQYIKFGLNYYPGIINNMLNWDVATTEYTKMTSSQGVSDGSKFYIVARTASKELILLARPESGSISWSKKMSSSQVTLDPAVFSMSLLNNNRLGICFRGNAFSGDSGGYKDFLTLWSRTGQLQQAYLLTLTDTLGRAVNADQASIQAISSFNTGQFFIIGNVNTLPTSNDESLFLLSFNTDINTWLWSNAYSLHLPPPFQYNGITFTKSHVTQNNELIILGYVYPFTAEISARMMTFLLRLNMAGEILQERFFQATKEDSYFYFQSLDENCNTTLLGGNSENELAILQLVQNKPLTNCTAIKELTGAYFSVAPIQQYFSTYLSSMTVTDNTIAYSLYDNYRMLTPTINNQLNCRTFANSSDALPSSSSFGPSRTTSTATNSKPHSPSSNSGTIAGIVIGCLLSVFCLVGLLALGIIGKKRNWFRSHNDSSQVFFSKYEQTNRAVPENGSEKTNEQSIPLDEIHPPSDLPRPRMYNLYNHL